MSTPADKRRGKRRRRNRRRRGPSEAGPAPSGRNTTEDVAAALLENPTSRKGADLDDLGETDLDPRDTLADTHGEKYSSGTNNAETVGLSSALNDDNEYRTVTTRLPLRHYLWMERFAARHGQSLSAVAAFAIKQLWLEDPQRLTGGTLHKEDFDADAD